MTDRDDALVLEFLSRTDAPCPACGYNCHALTRPACPECNAPLTLALHSEQARLGPWATAALPFALGAGFDGVVSILLAFGLVAFPPRGGAVYRMLTILSIFVVLALVQLVVLQAMYRRRHRFLAMPRRAQWHRAFVLFAGVFFFHAIYGLVIAGVL
ncbi:MAG: hypothetical protein GC200_07145 [Tepidisphaera sp.]|nr:hypothetical protein [Tepidisphaera sp.]